MNKLLHILYIGNGHEYTQQIAKQEQVSVTVVANSLEAVNYLGSGAGPDAVVCELHLPGQNGFFLFDWFRKHSAFDSTPFVLLADKFSKEVFKSALLKGVDDYLITTSTHAGSLLERLNYLCTYRNQYISNPSPAATNEIYRMPVSKRIFDIVVASSALLLVSPLLLLVILAIRLESKGKVYYIAKRVGRKTFDFYKLRSMRTGSDDLLKKLAKERNQYNTVPKQEEISLTRPCPRCSKLPQNKSCSPVMYIDKHSICDYWFNHQKKEAAKRNSTFVKIANDPRVTRVGKFIRNTSIDELPQLINVIKGDMSIVGNRPLPVYEAEMLTEDDMSKRFLAPAGITGLWQVELRGKGGSMSEEERKRLDNEYADHFKGNNFSFWYDIKLILRTIPALLQKSAV